MKQIGIWHVTDRGLDRLSSTSIGLEKNLENWIEEDPTLLEEGLEIVGRQIHVDRGFLDLLAINPQGQWVVIELKSGLTRPEALTQVLYYASSIATMPWDDLRQKVAPYLKERGKSLEDLVGSGGETNEDATAIRDVAMYVVGTGSYPGLDRMVDFLSGLHDVPIKLVSYDVFQIGDRHRILVRELTEPEITPPRVSRTRTVEELCARAEEHGIGREFRMILEAARRHDIYPRPYTGSIMYTPPANHTRMVFTVKTWTQADGLLQLYVGPQAFAEFYPVSPDEVRTLLRDKGWQKLTTDDVEHFVAGLDRLFDTIHEAEDSE